MPQNDIKQTNKEIGERVSLILKELRYKVQDMQEWLGLAHPNQVRGIINGSKGLTLKHCILINQNLPEVNIHWLITGNGTKVLSEKDSSLLQKEIDRLNNLLRDEQESEKAIKEKFLKMIDRIDNILARQEALMKENEELKAKIEELTS